MRGDVRLKPFKTVFAGVVEEMMAEYGLTRDTYTDKELRQTVAICVLEFDRVGADFIQWVEFGEDKRAKALDVLRAGREVCSMWDARNWR